MSENKNGSFIEHSRKPIEERARQPKLLQDSKKPCSVSVKTNPNPTFTPPPIAKNKP